MKSATIMQIPIYRVSHADFSKKRQQEFKRCVESRMDFLQEDRAAAESFCRNYRGPLPIWEYNQVIAWIELTVLSHAIKANLYIDDAKRFTERPQRRRNFVFRDYRAINVPLLGDEDKDALIKSVRAALLNLCESYPRLKGRHIDLRFFDELAPFVDWQGIIASCDARPTLRYT